AGKISSITGSPVYYAGGGGGGSYGVGGTGGLGGGGRGDNTAVSGCVSGTDGLGGGGGAGGPCRGGSGVVIISYNTGTVLATGGTVTQSGGKTIHTFTSSGSFAVGAVYQSNTYIIL
ncbi:hypothetical protein HGB25_03130, partial [Candidatus Saccharibacteria bacterium]|nr:hypothetical protein [Candidatus Saccharibacteria bacterium]